jgi:cell division protein FtsB
VAGEPVPMGGARADLRTVRRRRRRWIIATVALALVAFLYYKPVKAYVEAQEALGERTAEVRRLTAERTDLRRRLRLDGSGATLVREARRLGLVRPDERLFIVKGIDAWRRARAAERAADE